MAAKTCHLIQIKIDFSNFPSVWNEMPSYMRIGKEVHIEFRVGVIFIFLTFKRDKLTSLNYRYTDQVHSGIFHHKFWFYIRFNAIFFLFSNNTESCDGFYFRFVYAISISHTLTHTHKYFIKKLVQQQQFLKEKQTYTFASLLFIYRTSFISMTKLIKQ